MESGILHCAFRKEIPSYPGADPELLLGVGANPWGGGRLPNVLIIFSEKTLWIKEILVHRGAPGAPLQIRHWYLSSSNTVEAVGLIRVWNGQCWPLEHIMGFQFPGFFFSWSFMHAKSSNPLMFRRSNRVEAKFCTKSLVKVTILETK